MTNLENEYFIFNLNRCQHYRFLAGNPNFRGPSRFPAFQLKYPALCVFLIDRVMYLFVLFCVWFEIKKKIRLHGRG